MYFRNFKNRIAQVIPVRACRVEPLGDCGGNVAVDGEPRGKGKAFQVFTLLRPLFKNVMPFRNIGDLDRNHQKSPLQVEALPFTATVIGRNEVKR